MDRFVFLTFDGLSRGAVYAAFALALVLIWRATRIVNFAQGAMAVATAYVGYSVSTATGSYWLGFVVAVTGGLLLGAAAKTPTAYVDKVWTDSFLLAGSPAFQRPHQHNGHPLLHQPYLNGKLFFCGTETTALHGGYMEGAVTAAQRVATLLGPAG